MAHFSDYYPPDPDEEVIPQLAFAPYVADGTFEMRAFVKLLDESTTESTRERGVLHVFYAPPQEEWRIDAFIALLSVADVSGWSEAHERHEGTLLGYTQEQNDTHIERMLRSAHASQFPWLLRLKAERRKINSTSNFRSSERDRE